MGYKITSKERKSLKKIAERLVIQSWHHADNITAYYEIIAEAARAEFIEDNDTTLDDFLKELFQNASKQVLVNVIVGLEVDDEA